MKAGQGQTLIDVAVEHSGAAEAAWEIAMRSGVSLTDGTDGVELELPGVAADADTVSALEAAGAKPATDGEIDTELVVPPIGLIVIGRDIIR